MRGKTGSGYLHADLSWKMYHFFEKNIFSVSLLIINCLYLSRCYFLP